jgi:ABC-type phosphate transport system substrate-binding protein
MVRMSARKRIGSALFGVALGLLASAATAGEVVVVSAKDPLTTLSKEQVVDIFLGRMTDFPDGRRVVPIDQAEGSPARDAFYLKFADKSPAQIKAHWSKIIFTGRGQPPLAVSNGAEVKKLISANQGNIGYIDERMVDSSVKVLRVD